MSSRASSQPPAPEPGAFFDERAEHYDRAYDARTAGGYALRSRMSASLRLVGAGPGEALDAGMGPGRLLAELARSGWTVSGVDASAEMVARARQRLPTSADRIVHGRLESLPFPEASFDVVAATGVLEYAELEPALLEIARVLRPGGVAVVSYPNPRAYYVIWKTRVWYRLVRALKRLAGRPPIRVPQGLGLVQTALLEELMEGIGLHLHRTEFTCYLVLPSPLDYLLPGMTERLGEWLEVKGVRFARRLSCQLVYSAQKLSLIHI